MRKLLMLAVLAVALASCGGDSDSSTSDDKQMTQSAEERRAEIAQMENEVKANPPSPRNEKGIALTQRLLLRYRDYINLNPRDSMTAEYLFKAADLSIGVGKPDASISYIDRLLTDFPNFRKAPEMMLFKGFVYEVHMNQHAEAVKAYEALIDRYPNHRLAQDAQAAIDNLNLSEEELLEKLKQAEEKDPS